MDTNQKNNIAARAHYFNLEKRMKIRLDYIDGLKLPDYKYRYAILQLYNEIFLDCAQYKTLEVNMDYPTGTYISDDDGFRLDENEYPSLCRIVKEKTEFYEEMDEKDDEIEATHKMLFPDGDMPTKTLSSYDRLTLDELLKLELYDFFDYCRHGDGVPDLYILKYLEKYSDGFKPELVKLIWRDFWPYLEAEKEEFYGDSDRIQQAIERWRKLGRELPLHPDVEYTPPQRKDGKTDEQYDKICEMAKRFHDSQRGTLDVKKLLSTDSLDLWHLFKIESLLKQKMGVPVIEDDITPTGQRNSNKPCPISRDAVGFLFRELRNKGVIKPIPDTDLSESIEDLTGYSKEKIRQNNSMSDKAKEDLRGLLLSIADQLK
mgnify:CR=1 FL=1